MNRYIAIIILALLSAVGAQAQSLPETLHWMHAFAHAHSYWDLNPGLAQDELTFKGCQATQLSVYPSTPDHIGHTYSLTDLDPQTIVAKLWGDNGTIEFETTNSRDTIFWIDNGRKGDPSGSSWVLNFDTAPNAERFAKAFKHAVILCGGKTSAF